MDHRRIYPALIFIPLFYILVRYLPSIAFFVLITVATLMALGEFFALYFHQEKRWGSTILGGGLAICILASMQWSQTFPFQMVLGLSMISIVLFQVLVASKDPRMAFQMMVLTFGIFYVVFTLGHLLLLRQLSEGEALIFFVVLVTWSADTGAYYFGKLFGHRLLAPLLSPKKTIEGFTGGLVFGVIFAGIAHVWFLPSLSLHYCLLAGLLLPTAGLIGDLSESSFKRHVGVKDSGAIIPGHGGMLDRMDSFLLTAPTFYYYIQLVGIEFPG